VKLKITLAVALDGITVSASLESPAGPDGIPPPETRIGCATSADEYATAAAFARRLQEGVPGLLRVLEAAVSDRYQAYENSVRVKVMTGDAPAREVAA
jgi:hypothetical protein